MNEHFSYLLQRFLDKHISEAELHDLSAQLLESEYNEVFMASMEAQIRQTGLASVLDVKYYQNSHETESNDQMVNGIIESILLADKKNKLATSIEGLKSAANSHFDTFDAQTAPAHRVHFLKFLKTAWFRYAAAFILLAGIGSYRWLLHSRPQTLVSDHKQLPADILPGHEGAILTLSDGRSIVLDSMGNGVVARQRGTQAILRKGQLSYNASNAGEEAEYNTLVTPKGRQFQVQLPDGSRVWLNAASSIKYPTVFSVNNRKVETTGEVYFEVTHKVPAPFIVKDMNRNVEIQVLGTHFNVNSYSDEDNTKITLLEGSVKVVKGAFAGVLKPGHQAQVASGIKIVPGVNIDAVMAWKNGNFHFGNTTIQDLMKQIARWYDVDIIYQGKVPQREFGGEISREANLSQVLKILNESKVKSRLEGTKLIIE